MEIKPIGVYIPICSKLKRFARRCSLSRLSSPGRFRLDTSVRVAIFIHHLQPPPPSTASNYQDSNSLQTAPLTPGVTEKARQLCTVVSWSLMVVSTKVWCYRHVVLTPCSNISRSFVTARGHLNSHSKITSSRRPTTSNLSKVQLSSLKPFTSLGANQYCRAMGSVTDEQPEWTALKVRNTFLDYFKQNGHTFGNLCNSEFHKEQCILRIFSSFLIGRPSQ